MTIFSGPYLLYRQLVDFVWPVHFRLRSSKFSIFSLLLTICCVKSLPIDTVALAQTENADFSYIRFVPQAGDFPAKLSPLVNSIAEGTRLKSEKKTEAALDKFSKASAMGRSLITTLPRGYHDELYQLLGYSEQQLGESTKAIEYYDKALALKPSNDIALFNRALLLQQANRCDEALIGFAEVEWRATSAKFEVLYEMALCLNQLGRKEDALKLTERAYQANPQYLPVLRLLVKAQKEQLETILEPLKRAQVEAQIAAELTLIVSLDGSDRASALELGQMLIAKSDPLINAERLAEAGAIGKRLADQSGYKDAEGVRLLFNAQIKRGEVEQAKATLARGLTKSPDSELLKEATRQLEIEQSIKN